MLRIERQYHARNGKRRAEVVCSVVGACDLCGAQSEDSRQFDGDTHWSQAMASEKAKSAGYLERMSGIVRQLICPTCAEVSK